MANEVRIAISAKDEASPVLSRVAVNTKAMAADVDRSLASTRASFGSLRAPAAAGAVAIIGLGVASTKMASDLAEARNAVRQTFGADGTGVIEDFAKSSAEGFGVSKRAANEYAATLGAIFKAGTGSNQQAAALSRDAIKLAADLGSLRNLGIDEALEKIRAGLVGEAEPLRPLGILLSENVTKQAAYRTGLAAVGAELTEGQKVMARWIEIVRQAGPAHGDFGRTLAESLPNQMKVAQASTEDLADALGERLIPAARDSVGAINGLIDAVDGMPAPAETATVSIVGIAAALAALGLAVSPFKLIKGNLAELALAARAAAAAIVAVGAAPAIATAGGLAAVGIVGWRLLADEAAMAGNEFASSTKKAMDEGGDAVRETIADFEGLRTALEADMAAFRASGKDVTALERQVAELDEMLKLLRDSANAIPSAMEAAGSGMADAARQAEELTKRMQEGAAAMAAMVSTARLAAVREREAMFPSNAEEGAGLGAPSDFPALTGTDAVKKLQEDSQRAIDELQKNVAAANPLQDAIDAINARFNRALAQALVEGGERAFSDLEEQQAQIRAEIGRTSEELMQRLGVDLPTALGLAADAVMGASDAIKSAVESTQQRFRQDLADAFVKGGGGLEAYNRELTRQGPILAEIAHRAQQFIQVMGANFSEAYQLATNAVLKEHDRLKNMVRNELSGFLGQLAARRSAIELNAIEGFNVRPPVGGGGGSSSQPITINRTIGTLVINGGDQQAVVDAIERTDEPVLRLARQAFAEAR